MNKILAALVSGILFGIGIALSSMIDPNKVINFLDVAGNWDPSLAFVMAGALFVSFIAFHFIPKRNTPLFDVKFRLPTRTDIDKPLLIGAALFGIGWGMTGYCPAPVLSSLGLGLLDPFILLLSMLLGFTAQRYLMTK